MDELCSSNSLIAKPTLSRPASALVLVWDTALPDSNLVLNVSAIIFFTMVLPRPRHQVVAWHALVTAKNYAVLEIS
jgi:hypothetical protein